MSGPTVKGAAKAAAIATGCLLMLGGIMLGGMLLATKAFGFVGLVVWLALMFFAVLFVAGLWDVRNARAEGEEV